MSVTETVGWGILGTGGIANTFAKDLVSNGMRIAAVGSRNQETADLFAAVYDIPNAYASYEQLVADPSVDVVYVSSPHPYHHANARLALNAGKHVLVEKAFTVTQADAAALVDLAASHHLVILEAMWTRWLPHMLRLREIIAAGTLGEVRTIIADHGQLLPTDPQHRMNNPDLGGGALLDLGIYPVSFAWDIFGAPATVAALSTPTATGVDRQTAILLGYSDGRQALLHAALDARGANSASVIGTLGRVEIDPVWYSPTTFTVYNPDDEVIERFDQPITSRGMQYEAWEMERLIAEGRIAGEILPPSESVAIMGTLDEVRRQIGLRYPGES